MTKGQQVIAGLFSIHAVSLQRGRVAAQHKMLYAIFYLDGGKFNEFCTLEA